MSDDISRLTAPRSRDGGNEFAGNPLKRQNPRGAASGDCLFRHSEDDARIFILRDGMRSFLPHRQHASRTVSAHAGENRRRSVTPHLICARVEENVHRGAKPIHGRPLVERHIVGGALAHDLHMKVARCDQRRPADDAVAMLGLLNPHAAEPVETLGECTREGLRHMLNDDNPWRIGWKCRENLSQCFGPARRGSDRDNFIRNLSESSRHLNG